MNSNLVAWGVTIAILAAIYLSVAGIAIWGRKRRGRRRES